MSKPEKICNCMCHTKGITLMHMMGCCNYTYEQYINLDGTLDAEAFNKIKKEYETI